MRRWGREGRGRVCCARGPGRRAAPRGWRQLRASALGPLNRHLLAAPSGDRLPPSAWLSGRREGADLSESAHARKPHSPLPPRPRETLKHILKPVSDEPKEVNPWGRPLIKAGFSSLPDSRDLFPKPGSRAAGTGLSSPSRAVRGRKPSPGSSSDPRAEQKPKGPRPWAPHPMGRGGRAPRLSRLRRPQRRPVLRGGRVPLTVSPNLLGWGRVVCAQEGRGPRWRTCPCATRCVGQSRVQRVPRKAGWALAHQGRGRGASALGAGGRSGHGARRGPEGQSVSVVRADQRLCTRPVVSSALKIPTLGPSSKLWRGARRGFNARNSSRRLAFLCDVNVGKFCSPSRSRPGSAICPTTDQLSCAPRSFQE